jgi:hypothetical protein
MKAVMIGSGNVSWHLCKRMQECGIELLQIVNLHSGKFNSAFQAFTTPLISGLPSMDKDADVYFICVPDDDISSLELPSFSAEQIVIHTAGSVPIDNLRKYHTRYGCIYPLQTLSIGKEVKFEEVPLLVEASDKDSADILMQLAEQLSDTVEYCTGEKRAELHLAAVFVNNFSNHLYNIADLYLAEKGLSFDLLKPLIKETVAKLDNLKAAEAQTGPAKRHDTVIMQKHLQMLSKHPQWAAIYELMSTSIGAEEMKKGNA